jgi:3-(3-hydroxy-phenyl)propionate hydroxylase
MTPKSEMERLFRDEVLSLAADHGFARKLVNSGRLSLPCSLDGLSLQTASGEAPTKPGEPCKDAPIEKDGKPGWLLHQLGGEFVLLATEGARVPADPGLRVLRVGQGHRRCAGAGGNRYGRGLAYLIRPDQHVAAVFEQAGCAGGAGRAGPRDGQEGDGRCLISQPTGWGLPATSSTKRSSRRMRG